MKNISVLVFDYGQMTHCFRASRVEVHEEETKIVITIDNAPAAQREDITDTLVAVYDALPEIVREQIPADIRENIRKLSALKWNARRRDL